MPTVPPAYAFRGRLFTLFILTNDGHFLFFIIHQLLIRFIIDVFPVTGDVDTRLTLTIKNDRLSIRRTVEKQVQSGISLGLRI